MWLVDVIVCELRILASKMGILSMGQSGTVTCLRSHSTFPLFLRPAPAKLLHICLQLRPLSIHNKRPYCQGVAGNGHHVYKSSLRLPALTDVNACDHLKTVTFLGYPSTHATKPTTTCRMCCCAEWCFTPVTPPLHGLSAQTLSFHHGNAGREKRHPCYGEEAEALPRSATAAHGHGRGERQSSGEQPALRL